MSNAARKSPRRNTVRTFGTLAAGSSLLVAGVGTTVALAPTAGAASFSVTNLDDSGLGSLRQAIADANAAAGADTIEFATGLTGTITLTSDPLVIYDDLNIFGPGADLLTVSGGGTLPGFISFFDTGGGEADPGTVVISGLTVADSKAMDVPIPQIGLVGNTGVGAITAFNSSLTLSNVVVRDNFSDSDLAEGEGLSGAAVSHFGGGDLAIIDSQIRDNTSTGEGTHGVILNFGGDLSIVNSAITGNSQTVGGALLAISGYFLDEFTFGGSIEISSSVISGNTTESGWGGGVAYANDVTVRDSVITDNHVQNPLVISASGGFGSGGFDVLAFSSATISNTRVSGNSSPGVGGLTVMDGSAIYNGDSDSPFVAILDRLTITDNVGGPIDGQPGDTSGKLGTVGGLALLGDAALTSSTISGNSGVGVDVSGLYEMGNGPSAVNAVNTPSATRSIRSLIRGNRLNVASNEPLLFPTVTIDHTTIADNTGDGLSSLRMNSTDASADALILPTVTIGHSLLAGNAGQDLATPATLRWSLLQRSPSVAITESDNNLIGYDPELQPLENISLTVGVRPILWGSAAWNAGNPDFAPPPETDQRGLPRIVAIIDIGAYEVQGDLVLPTFTG
jgi:hypothetical protein